MCTIYCINSCIMTYSAVKKGFNGFNLLITLAVAGAVSIDPPSKCYCSDSTLRRN